MQANKFMFHITSMITLSLILALGLLHTALAAHHEGVKVYNGTADDIVEAYVSPAEKCDMVKCGEWMKTSGTSLPIKRSKEGGILGLPSVGSKDDPVCVWDIKIVTQKLFSGEPSRDHVFKNVNMCKSDGMLISFVRPSPGMFAIQNYKDDEGRVDRIAIPSQTNGELWASPDIIKRSGDLGVGALFYNGLEQDITAVQTARADKCDAYICGQWGSRAENLLPLTPQNAIAALTLKADVCKLDMRLTSKTGQDGADEVSEFKSMDFCLAQNNRSVVSFVKTVYGVLAIHTFPDDQGRVQRIVYISGA